ncbi:MAG TPA: transaldolase, partial [Acetobacteraceae bacterium]|nr:transaldolase [Acetobacteraceae bacterium]
KLFADQRNTASTRADTVDDAFCKHFARLGEGDYCATLAYIERNETHRAALQEMRLFIRERKRVATVAEFGPRFLHSTGQAYKGGPNSGVFLQITADDPADLPVPGERYTFGIVKAAQARGDFDVLAARKRRALRVHISGDLEQGLARIKQAIEHALS